MQISHTIHDKIIVLHLSGRFDATGVPQVKKLFRELMDENFLSYIFNFADVEFVDSSGLGCLISCIHVLKPKMGILKVAEMQPKVRAMFELIQLHKVFESFEKLQSALDSFK